MANVFKIIGNKAQLKFNLIIEVLKVLLSVLLLPFIVPHLNVNSEIV